MAYKSVFRRYELKYLLFKEQKEIILNAISPYMQLDSYGHTTIRNIYFDTDSYQLIRRSIEKPAYKEKLRIRSYSKATPETEVFVELKKKYDHVVYKRRIALPERVAMDWVCGKIPSPIDTQISREIDYFKSHYTGLRPSVFLSYERDAYFERDGGDFRLTFDQNILVRDHDLSLCSDAGGRSVMDPDLTMMELKCSGALPLWMVEVLSRERIYKTSFSKYGVAYQKYIFQNFSNNQYIKEQSHAYRIN